MGNLSRHQYSNTEGNTTTMFEDIQDTLGSHGDHGIKPVPTVIPTPTEFQSAGQAGFKALWVVFVIMVIASIVFTIRSWNVPVQRRLYHVITTIITLTAASRTLPWPAARPPATTASPSRTPKARPRHPPRRLPRGLLGSLRRLEHHHAPLAARPVPPCWYRWRPHPHGHCRRSHHGPRWSVRCLRP